MSNTINLLRKRRVGVLFCATEGGALREMNRLEKVRYKLDPRYRRRIQDALKLIVTNALIEAHYSRDIITNEAMRHLPVTIYDRSKIPDSILQELVPGAQTLSQVDLTEQNITLDESIYQRSVITAQRALALGIKTLTTGGGANGSQFLTDLNGRPIAVFKLKHNPARHASRFSRLIQRVKARLFSSHTIGYFSSKRECLSETAAPLIARALELNNVPQTGEERLTFGHEDVREGSVQLLVPGKVASPVKKLGCLNFLMTILTLLHIQSGYLFHAALPRLQRLEMDQQAFEKLIIFDFISGNIDRHLDNFLITDTGGIFAIDNGRSFPNEYSKTFFSLHNQYLWRAHPQAKVTFSEESKTLINRINPDDLAQIIKERFSEENSEEVDAIVKRLDERIAVLKRFAREGRPLYQLGLVRTEREFTATLSGELSAYA